MSAGHRGVRSDVGPGFDAPDRRGAGEAFHRVQLRSSGPGRQPRYHPVRGGARNRRHRRPRPEAGGTASAYGHSSGAGLVLHAAAHGLPIAKIVLHDPPYAPNGEEERQRAREYGEKLKAMLSKDRRGDAVELFMTT